MTTTTLPSYTATRNACKLCTPLGASLAFKGIEKTVPLLHGSQGCATYIRRYLISHFKEPVDIASSNFSEETAVFGGGANLMAAMGNISRQYKPHLIGVATTCLSETIGDDVPMAIAAYKEGLTEDGPEIVHVSTPSYRGTHADGFHGAIRAVVAALAGKRTGNGSHINLLPGMVSPEDLRHLKEIVADFGIETVMLPDYSETLDGPPWSEYQRIQEGGTPLSDIRRMGEAAATVTFGATLAEADTAGSLLFERFGISSHHLDLPIGVRNTDRFFSLISRLSGKPVPVRYEKERGRLIDSLVDGHKYVSGVRAVVYGEEDLVLGLCGFLREIGIVPVLAASGGKSGFLEKKLREMEPGFSRLGMQAMSGVDFMDITEAARSLSPDLIIGHSKGYAMSRDLKIPLIRVGFPVHDRIGGGRILHLGYRGAQQLFDRIANTIIDHRQTASPVGYTYM